MHTGSVDHVSAVLSTVASKTEFRVIVELFVKLKSTTGLHQKKTRCEAIQYTLEKWRSLSQKIYGVPPSSDGPESFFPFLRLLIPQLDERSSYCMQEASLTRMFKECLGLSATCDAVMKMLSWRRHVGRKTGHEDYASVAAVELCKRLPPKQEHLSVDDVNRCLTGLAEAASLPPKDRKSRLSSIFYYLLNRIEREELLWLIRLILRDLQLGCGHEAILEAFHPSASDLYASTARLSSVCAALSSSDTPSLNNQISIHVCQPVLPMRAEIWNSERIRTVLDTTHLVAEIKYDGERFHIHKNGDEFRFFSRPGNEYTEIFGRNSSEGTLVPHIAHCFRKDAQSFILDGELCPYYVTKKQLGSKADVNWIKKLTGSHGCHVCFVAFDILHLNGETLVDRPLSERIKVLTDLFSPEDGRLHHAVRREVRTIKECVDYLNEVSNLEEGLIIKDPRSYYKPKIQSPDWWKLKPEFIAGISEQLDLLIIGCYRGNGDTISSTFLLGAADSHENGVPKKFRSVCEVSVGLKKADLWKVRAQLKAHVRPWTSSVRPEFMVLGKSEGNRLDFWIPPEKSCVLQIRAAQLTHCPSNGAGLTLRFPRVARVRFDKSWTETTTLEDIRRIQRERNGRLGAEKSTVADLETYGQPVEAAAQKAAPVKRKVVRAVLPSLPTHAKLVDTRHLVKKTDLFSGKQFCVMDGTRNCDKQKLERLVVENGGSCVLSKSGTMFCIVSSSMCVKVKNMVKSSPADVVHPKWILRCVEAGGVLPWLPDEIVYAKPETRTWLKRGFDADGDGYFDTVDGEKVKVIFDSPEMVKKARLSVRSGELDKFAHEKFGCLPELSLFSGLKFFVDDFSDDDICEIPAVERDLVVSAGGIVLKHLDPTVSHVVVRLSVSASRLQKLMAHNTCARKFKVVTHEWVRECCAARDLLEERHFFPVVGDVSPRPSLRPLFDEEAYRPI